MARQPPPLNRKSPAPWDRLRPAKQDPLESMGYVSKGDNRLLDLKTQEVFYQKVVARYMRFCTDHSKQLESAFASLTLNAATQHSPDQAQVPPVRPSMSLQNSKGSSGLLASKYATPSPAAPQDNTPAPEDELSTILMALRKLREGLLGSASTSTSPLFSQRVHVFNIRLAILALHPASYHPSLLYLLRTLHTQAFPLPVSELSEMTTYLILDLALRQNDLIAACTVRRSGHRRFGYANRDVDTILQAIITSNWIAFWRVYRNVDGYVRAIMSWYFDTLRKTTLKTFGRAYLKTDLPWLLRSSAGSLLTWEQLVEKENVGWLRDQDTIIVRKPRSK